MDIGVISNAPMDITVHVSKQFLEQQGFIEGVCTYLTHEQERSLVRQLRQSLSTMRESPGGCGVNIAAWLGKLGHPALLMAPFASDDAAGTIKKSIASRGVTCLGFDYPGQQSRNYTLITPGGQRTFATWQSEFPGDRIGDALPRMKQRSIIVIDGYLLRNHAARKALMAALDAPPAGWAFCPNDTSIIEGYPEEVGRLAAASRILFMNEPEAAALEQATGHSVQSLCRQGKTAAVTRGEQGARIYDVLRVLDIPAAPLPAPMVNTSGAGDAFAAGFLAGRCLGRAVEACGAWGACCAASVLTVDGTWPDMSELPMPPTTRLTRSVE